jgi:hypothetical protein
MAEKRRFLLRLNPELFEALRRWADDDLRSINAQIEYLLAEQARRAGRWERPSGARPTGGERYGASAGGAPLAPRNVAPQEDHEGRGQARQGVER